MKPKEFAFMFVGMVAVCYVGFILGASSTAGQANDLADGYQKAFVRYDKAITGYSKLIVKYEKLTSECHKLLDKQ